ncbi:GSCOCG00005861001-RA-CDS, partial [Cotesia congregata]
KENTDPARIRTWNLLIRSQTRYPLRHRTIYAGERIFYILRS